MFKTLTELKRANKAAGGHFWDFDTVVFFDSRNETRLIDGRWFVVSIQYHGSHNYIARRSFKVWFASRDGHVHQAVEHDSLEDSVAWIDHNKDRFTDCCDGGCCQSGDVMAIRYPLGEDAAAFLCYNCVCTENKMRRENADDRGEHDYFELVKGNH